jgi:tetratricopeptide (TPR) repeat protein
MNLLGVRFQNNKPNWFKRSIFIMSQESDLVCPGCGGEIVPDSTGEFGTCIFCGRKIRLIEKTIVEHTGTVKVDGIAGITEKLTSAYQNLEQNNIEKANKLYKEICELDPNNANAWWGRFICELSFAEYYGFKDKYQQTGPVVKAQILQELLQYADRAIELAESKEIKNFYIEKTQDYRDFIASIPQYLEELAKKEKKSKKTKLIVWLSIIGIAAIFIILGLVL